MCTFHTMPSLLKAKYDNIASFTLTSGKIISSKWKWDIGMAWSTKKEETRGHYISFVLLFIMMQIYRGGVMWQTMMVTAWQHAQNVECNNYWINTNLIKVLIYLLTNIYSLEHSTMHSTKNNWPKSIYKCRRHYVVVHILKLHQIYIIVDILPMHLVLEQTAPRRWCRGTRGSLPRIQGQQSR